MHQDARWQAVASRNTVIESNLPSKNVKMLCYHLYTSLLTLYIGNTNERPADWGIPDHPKPGIFTAYDLAITDPTQKKYAQSSAETPGFASNDYAINFFKMLHKHLSHRIFSSFNHNFSNYIFQQLSVLLQVSNARMILKRSNFNNHEKVFELDNI